jgi:hypothetical protein
LAIGDWRLAIRSLKLRFLRLIPAHPIETGLISLALEMQWARRESEGNRTSGANPKVRDRRYQFLRATS